MQMDPVDALLFWMNSNISYVLGMTLHRVPHPEEVQHVLGSIVDRVRRGRHGEIKMNDREYIQLVEETLRWVSEKTGVKLS